MQKKNCIKNIAFENNPSLIFFFFVSFSEMDENNDNTFKSDDDNFWIRCDLVEYDLEINENHPRKYLKTC